MKRYLLLVSGMLVATSTVALAQGAASQAADEVIAVVRAEWAAARQRNVAEANKNIADDCTQFTADAATRLEGKALLTRIAEAANKDAVTTLSDEMLNPKVQIYGDVAIVSYNYFGQSQDKDGKVKGNRAKSTRVYARQGGKWMLVHANFAADPLPAQ